MLSRHLWKLTLSAALVVWAVFTLLPLKDQPFGDYVKKEATAKPAEKPKPEPKTFPGTKTAVAFESIPERWPMFTATLLEEVVRSISEPSFQIAAFSFLPLRSSITAADLRTGFLVVITSRPH